MKKFLTAAWLILVSSVLSYGAFVSGTRVSDTIVPLDDTDEYPTHDAKYGKEHWILVANAAERTSTTEPGGISEMRRTLGMIAFQLDTYHVWRLSALPNTWTDLGEFNATASTVNVYTQDGTLQGARTVTGNNNSLTFSGLGNWSLTGNGTSTIQSANMYVNGTTGVNINQSGNHFQFPFIAAALASDDAIVVQNPSTKVVKRTTATLAQALAQTNLFNTTGTLTGNRSLLGGGYDFTIQNVDDLTMLGANALLGSGGLTVLTSTSGSVTVSALTNVSISGAEVRLNYADNKYVFKKTPTAAAGTDEILGIDVATGEVRHAASATIANIATASTFYNSSGTLSANRTVTGDAKNLSFNNLGILTVGASQNVQTASTSAAFTAPTTGLYASTSLILNTPGAGAFTAETGQFLRMASALGDVEYATAFYTGSAIQTGSAYAVANTDLVPDYDSATQHPPGTVAFIKFDSNSVGGDTLAVGPSVGGVKIQRHDGSDIAADDIVANKYYLLVRNGIDSGSVWILQGSTASTLAASAPLNNAKVVDTVADLVDFDPTSGNELFTRGYWAAGDGGAGRYYWVNNQTSTNTGSKIASSVDGSWVLVNDTVDVLQWGAKRDASASASAAIQSALTYCLTTTKKHLLIPSGDYLFTSGVLGAGDNLRVDIYGRCKNAAGTNSYLFSFNNASAKTYSAGVLTSGLIATNVVIDGHGVGIIDQNSQNSSTFDIDTEMGTLAQMAFVVERHKDTTVKNLRIQNTSVYGFYGAFCDNLTVQNCVILSGTPRNATRSGALHWGAFQDGLHIVDCSRSKVIDNYVEGADDALACDAYFTKCGDNLIRGNTIKQIFRCINPVTGLYYTNYMHSSAAIYIGTGVASQYAVMTNVIVSNNRIIGGPTSGGGFSIRMGASTNLVAENILIEGNTLAGLNDPGDTAVAPNGVGVGIHIQGGKNIIFRGNQFHQYNRLMSVTPSGPKPEGLVFENNSFQESPWRIGNHFEPSVATGLIDVRYAADVVIRNNIFNNIEGMAISVGQVGSTNLVQRATITGNRINNANIHYRSSGAWTAGVPTNTANAIIVSSCPDYEISNNVISTNAAGAIRVDYSSGRGVIRNNTIDNIGVTGMTINASADAIRVSNQFANTSISTEVSGNIMTRLGGAGVVLVNAGYLDVRDNTVDSSSLFYGIPPMYILLQGTISDPSYTRHGGAFGRNAVKNAAGEAGFYFFSTVTNTASHTGGRLVFDASEQLYGSNVGNVAFSPGFFGLMTAHPGYTSVAAGYTAKSQDSIIKVTAAAAITLPDAVVNYGKKYTIKRSTGSTVTVVSSGAQTFDGVASPYTLVSSADFVSDGANWIVTSAF